MAHFNRRVTNHLTRPLARRLPGFGIVIHTGRKSNREYETPVNVFKAPGGYLIALTYGADSEWVKNVLAADGCELITRAHSYHLSSPRIVPNANQHPVPSLVRPALRLLRVTDFLHLSAQRCNHPDARASEP